MDYTLRRGVKLLVVVRLQGTCQTRGRQLLQAIQWSHGVNERLSRAEHSTLAPNLHNHSAKTQEDALL